MSFDFGEQRADGSVKAEAVKDEEVLAVAEAGADWFCAQCEAGNGGDRQDCKRCGAPRSSTPKPPDPKPSSPPAQAPPARQSGKGGCLGCASCGGLLVLGGAGFFALLLFMGFLLGDSTVDASVTERQWSREVTVERLTPSEAVDWREALPEPASVPGSGALSPGLGTLHGCDTLKCWPRLAGETTARVAGRQWTRTITTRVMRTDARSGWRDAVPRRRGQMPTAGSGGTEGYIDLSCRSRERRPERCRQVQVREACGTEQSCTVRDLGSGFAEEVCVDVTRYCTRSEERCDPAVREDYCNWTQLTWGAGRTVQAEGTEEPPRWPSFTARPDESVSRTERYVLNLEPLAGAAVGALEVSEQVFGAQAPGRYVSVVGRQVRDLPQELVPPDTDRVDCQLPQAGLVTRDRCRFERWAWVEEPPLVATSKDSAPDWPDGRLGEDGRESRREWMEVALSWERGRREGQGVFQYEVDQWDRWAPGRRVPVVVDHQAAFVRFDEGVPAAAAVREGGL